MRYNAYLSLGSNLGNREENLRQAISLLEERAGKVISRSAFYYTEPWGFESVNGFVNNCIALQTDLDPEALLLATQEIERELGRLKKSDGSYSDRMIDIDIILIDGIMIDTPLLKVPHPLMHLREFVLAPLREIAPDLKHPVLVKSIDELTKLLEK